MILERGARHFEIEVGSSPRRAPARSLVEIVKAFSGASAKGDATWRQGEFALQIVGARFNKAETRAILLLHFKQGDAETVSAHLVIDLKPTVGSTYAAALEDAAGLSRPVLEHAFGAFAQRWCSFYTMGPGGKFAEVRPRFSFVEAGYAVISVQQALATCEAQMLPEVSAKLDALLRQRVTGRAA